MVSVMTFSVVDFSNLFFSLTESVWRTGCFLASYRNLIFSQRVVIEELF